VRGPVPLPALVGLVAYLTFLVAHRLFELRVSARHELALRARGGFEVAGRHFPLFVILHTLYPIALAAEVLYRGARPGPLWPLWLALLACAEALRIAVHRALGERWTVRIWVVPGLPRVERGIYRWLRHPNYVAVTIELVAGALLFGAHRTAFAASVLNLLALLVRIPAEDRALAEAAAASEAGHGRHGKSY
jgi:methyltransferase